MLLKHVLALTAAAGLASAKCVTRSKSSSTSSYPTIAPQSSSSSRSSSSSSQSSSSHSSSSSLSSSSLSSSSHSSTSSLSSTTSLSSSSQSATSSSISISLSSSSSLSSSGSSSSSTSLATASSSSSSVPPDTTESTVSSTTLASPTSTIPPDPTQICEAYGYRLVTLAISSSDDLVDNTFDGCSALCSATSGCQSFSIQIETGGECSLYNRPLYQDFVTGSSGSTVYFDNDCPKPVVSGPTLSSYDPGTTTVESVPTTAGSVVTFAPYVEPTVVTSDSPPYTPTGPQETPTDDNEFIATYTYTQFELTVVATGSPPITTGIPHPTGTDLPALPCMISPGRAAPFSLLNENFVPMVSRTNSIGPLLQPTEAPAPDDPILNPQTFTVPSFYLQEPATGDAGVYDMVYADTNQFVAMSLLDGEVTLVDDSTGPAGNLLWVTTIFNVDCLGIIYINYGGANYTWTTDGRTARITRSTGGTNNMKALPVTVPAVDEMFKDRKRTQELTEMLMRRAKLQGRVNADFNAPQCPPTPTGLVSKTKQGYELGEGNFCDNLSEYWQLSPFDFDDACEIQSLCYDQCEHFSWVGCNAIFAYSMLFTCADNFESWWEVVQAVACAAQATYFTGVAATQTGRDLYYKAQDAMCRCFCSDPPDTCVYTDGSFYCANIHGSDLNNCGNCGRQCGANSACHSGVCGCPRDQCGTTCLDFRNNPNNCGSCGNVCNPAYCIGGQCYEPNPDECAPDQPVTNYMFDTYSPTWKNWTMAAYTGSTLGTDIVFTPTRYTPQTGSAVYALGVTMNDLPSGGRHASVVQKNVKMCPGFEYELYFNMGYVNQVDNGQVTSNADCQVRWLTGTPSTWDGTDGYQYSPYYNIGASNPTYATFGPWTISVAEGQTGVTKVKANLYISLTAILSCNTPVGGTGHFVLTDVELKPTIATSKRTIGEQKADIVLEQRDGSAINMSDVLAPYFTDGEVSASYKPVPVVKGRKNWAVGSA